MTSLAPIDTPVTQNRLFRGAARAVLKLFGWDVVGTLPAEPKLVIIGAPHTSNWDFALMLLGAAHFGIKPYWMGKDALFPRPVAPLMRWLGGIPIDRSQPRNVVAQAVDAFRQHERMMLLIPPEGTRGWRPRWRTGFYYIALGADVPILLAFVDFASRRVGLGPLLRPSGDLEADLRRIQAFYADKVGKFPENASPVLPPEGTPDAGPGAPSPPASTPTGETPTVIRKLLMSLAALVFVGGVAGVALSQLLQPRPDDLGARDGRLRPCPDTPNCVSSQADPADGEHHISPLAYEGDRDAARARLLRALRATPRTTVVTERPDYVHAQARSPSRLFIDDLEFLLDDEAKLIHVRSGARLGRRDLGKNRERIELVRDYWARAGE